MQFCNSPKCFTFWVTPKKIFTPLCFGLVALVWFPQACFGPKTALVLLLVWLVTDAHGTVPL